MTRLELMVLAREKLVDWNGAWVNGICAALDDVCVSQADHQLAYHLGQLISVKLRVGPQGEDWNVRYLRWYPSWLHHATGRDITYDQIKAGRLLWLDQMIKAEHEGLPFPPPPLLEMK